MRLITSAALAELTGAKVSSNLISAHAGLAQYGIESGLEKPHRLIPYLAQVTHESMGFKYDREIWGPTKAQVRYEGRADLGNTEPGDGSLFRGRGPIQITGRYNYRSFTLWCRARFGKDVPDFEQDPDAVNTDPWEGLVAIWYWQTRALNTYCDEHKFEALTRKINGGINGLADRQARWDRLALTFLGHLSVRAAQTHYGLKVDGDCGRVTRAKLQEALVSAPVVAFAQTKAPASKAASPNPLGWLMRLLGILRPTLPL